MALILGNFICVSRPFRIVSGVTLNANIKIEGMGGGIQLNLQKLQVKLCFRIVDQ